MAYIKPINANIYNHLGESEQGQGGGLAQRQDEAATSMEFTVADFDYFYTILQARIKWIAGKIYEYQQSRSRYRDVPPLAIDLSRAVLPVAMVLTLWQRKQAGLLLPYARSLHSAALHLEAIMPMAMVLAERPPPAIDEQRTLVLRAKILQARALLATSQQLLNIWESSPSYFHAGRVPRWEALLTGDPAGFNLPQRGGVLHRLLSGDQFVDAQMRTRAEEAIKKRAAERIKSVMEEQQRKIFRKPPLTYFMYGLGLGALALGGLYAYKHFGGAEQVKRYKRSIKSRRKRSQDDNN